jgi:hypothetical protein
VFKGPSSNTPKSELSVVVVKWLQVLIDVQRFPHQAQVERAKHAQIFVVFIFYKLHHNLFFGLKLKHLKD